jgi:hypothetical protein
VGTQDSSGNITYSLSLDDNSDVIIKDQNSEILSTHNPYDYFSVEQLQDLNISAVNLVMDQYGFSGKDATALVNQSMLPDVTEAGDYALAASWLAVGGTAAIGLEAAGAFGYLATQAKTTSSALSRTYLQNANEINDSVLGFTQGVVGKRVSYKPTTPAGIIAQQIGIATRLAISSYKSW